MVVDAFLTYQFIKKLTTPFIQWPAYKLGLIDDKGNFLKDRTRFTTQEKNAMGLFDIMIVNLKKLLAKVPGGASRLGTVAATLFLLRSKPIREDYNVEDIEKEFLEIFEMVKTIKEDGAVAVNSAGSGSIAGIGQPVGSASGFPPVSKAAADKYKKKNKKISPAPLKETDTFAKDNKEFISKNYKNKNNKIAKEVTKEVDTINKSFKESFVKKNSLVDESTLQYHKELNPKLWDSEGNLKPEVRNTLLQIADTWISFTKIPHGIVRDIVITGGNVNYNYTPNSDIDLHIVLPRDSLNPNRAFVDEYLQDKKVLWTLQHENISIYGYPVELYAQDINEVPHQNQGVYSIVDNTWLARPQLLDLDFENDYHLQLKVQFYIDMIDDMILNNASDESIDVLKDRIKKMRSDSISKEGEFSFGNLVFKELRNAGYIDKLNNYKKERLDKSLSLG